MNTILNKKSTKYLIITLVFLLAIGSLFGYYSMFKTFKNYGPTHLLKIIYIEFIIGILLSLYFALRRLFKLPTKVSLLSKIKIIFLTVIITFGYLAFKPIQLYLFMGISLSIPIIIVLYLFNDTIWFIKHNKKEI